MIRKARQSDLPQMALLITKNIGTCDVLPTDTRGGVKEEIIFSRNLKHCTANLNKYFVYEKDGKVVGICGISNIKSKKNSYGVNLPKYKEVLYLVTDKDQQRQGIGSALLNFCTKNHSYPIVYEAWGEKQTNSKVLLEKLGFELIKDLGRDYYKNLNYCPTCSCSHKNCNSCAAELWILY